MKRTELAATYLTTLLMKGGEMHKMLVEERMKLGAWYVQIERTGLDQDQGRHRLLKTEKQFVRRHGYR